MAALLGLAGWLVPDPRGFGTHEQLGLAPCVFRERTGTPCPSCGMTTAFAQAVRLRPVRSWRANPAGCLLAAAAPVLAGWSLAAAVTGRPRPWRSVAVPMAGAIVGASALAVLAWAVRLLRH